MGGLIAGYVVHAVRRARADASCSWARPDRRAARRDGAAQVLAPAADRSTRSCEAHRKNLGILMIHDPRNIDELAVYMPEPATPSQSRVRGKHVSHTGTLAQCLPGMPGRLAGIWGEHDATAVPYLAERRAEAAGIPPGRLVRHLPGRRPLGAVRGARSLQPAACRAAEAASARASLLALQASDSTIPPRPSRPRTALMSHAELAKTIDDAFEKRDGIGPSTKGAGARGGRGGARPARPRRGARRRAPGRRQLAGQPVAQEGACCSRSASTT